VHSDAPRPESRDRGIEKNRALGLTNTTRWRSVGSSWSQNKGTSDDQAWKYVNRRAVICERSSSHAPHRAIDNELNVTGVPNKSSSLHSLAALGGSARAFCACSSVSAVGAVCTTLSPTQPPGIPSPYLQWQNVYHRCASPAAALRRRPTSHSLRTSAHWPAWVYDHFVATVAPARRASAALSPRPTRLGEKHRGGGPPCTNARRA